MLSVCLAIAGCSSTPDEGPRSSLSADEVQQMRGSCAFQPGMTAGLTLQKGAPIGREIPIDTVVVVMMENRSFDHFLGQLPKTGQTDVDVAPDDASNPDPSGAAVKRFHLSDYCFIDTNHGWEGSHRQFNDGKNDGFVITNAPPFDTEDNATDGTRAMGYYDQNDLPWLYAAANAYAISDRYFASLLGPTFPNREYLYAATSYGKTVNDVFTSGNKANFVTLIEGYNAKAKMVDQVSWHVYYEGVPGPAVFLDTLTQFLDNVSLSKTFFDDAAAGTLSNVNVLDANLRDEWGGGDDDHPPGDVQMGDVFLAKVVDAVTHSPQWPHLALFITFDEHGGIYDHVAPPKACAPDDNAPMVPPGATAYDFARYGFRVPLIVVSPYAKAHHVSHVVNDHTSILRFIEARFHLPALTKRDANAEPLYDLFDFAKPALLTPPSLPTPPVDQAKLDACKQRFPLKQLFGDGGADMSVGDLAVPADGGTVD